MAPAENDPALEVYEQLTEHEKKIHSLSILTSTMDSLWFPLLQPFNYLDSSMRKCVELKEVGLKHLGGKIIKVISQYV